LNNGLEKTFEEQLQPLGSSLSGDYPSNVNDKDATPLEPTFEEKLQPLESSLSGDYPPNVNDKDATLWSCQNEKDWTEKNVDHIPIFSLQAAGLAWALVGPEL
jgi:hypothetical protein